MNVALYLNLHKGKEIPDGKTRMNQYVVLAMGRALFIKIYHGVSPHY
jgi:hypothetical protein